MRWTALVCAFVAVLTATKGHLALRLTLLEALVRYEPLGYRISAAAVAEHVRSPEGAI